MKDDVHSISDDVSVLEQVVMERDAELRAFDNMIKDEQSFNLALVTMPDEFLNKVDGLAETEQRSRSELIREALRTYMHRISAKQAKNAPKNAEILESLIG